MRRVVLVLVLLAVAGCGQRDRAAGPPDPADAAEPAEAESLWGNTFLVTEAYLDETPMATRAGADITLEFTAERLLIANAGCNTLSGPVSVDGGRLSARGELATTEMACTAPLQSQDDWLFEFLDRRPSWELADSRLTLRGGDTELVLTERDTTARPLTGTVWTVDTLEDGQTASSVPSGIPPATVEFGPDRVEVFAGCNSGSAAYRVAGTTLTVDPLMMTRKACAGEIMAVESAVTGVLSGPVGFTVESTTLTLNHPSGKGLRLRAE